jgi:eukaryotic-like serine/threonine-protein kinase
VPRLSCEKTRVHAGFSASSRCVGPPCENTASFSLSNVNSPDRWRLVDRLYHEALAREESARATFLREACAGDEALRLQVESLIAYASKARDFLAVPAVEGVSPAALASVEPTKRLIGVHLGPYHVEALLGVGGMGEVYRARDTRLGRDVAIKILPEPFIADADRRDRFEREARLLASLNHPHIGTIYGFEERDGIHALVLELIEGETLAARLDRSSMSVREALHIGHQVAEALEAAHDKAIVHRDLKPANIAITPDGVVKVLDFGLAKVGSNAGSSSDLTRSPTFTAMGTGEGVILGSAESMSPEQARGRVVDKRTDIWAFGSVLYHMLTGRKAFVGETISDTIAAVLGREPDWTALPPATPPAIRRLLSRCLEKDLNRRLHDIADARIEIEDALREPHRPIETAVARHDRVAWASRRAMVLLSTAAVLVIALGVIAAFRWWSVPVPRDASPSRLMITLPAVQTLEKGRFPPLALSSDGRLLAYVAATDGGTTNLYLRPLDELEARPIPQTEGASTPFFSPDGRWLGFYADGMLKKLSIAGGVPLVICEAPVVWSASWGEHDDIVFATTLAASGLWRVSANGGEPVQITTPKGDETQHGYPQLLPGGTQILFGILRKNAWHAATVALSGGEPRLIGNGRVIGEGAQYISTGHLVYAQSGGLVVTPFDPAVGDLDKPSVPLLEHLVTSRFGGAYFAFAANSGTLVYVPSAATVTDRALLRVERDGRASPLIDARAGYQYPTLSPDGTRTAVMIDSEMGSDIWLVDLARATRTRFTTGGIGAFPVWGPDGTKLAFQSMAPGPFNLFWKPTDGSADAQPLLKGTDAAARSWPNTGAALLPGTLPTLSGAGPQFPTSWSADGSTIAFHERKPDGKRDIWVVAPGGDPVPFLLTPFDERSPRFSPDGKWLAYVSDESGRNDVYVQPYPGPGSKWLISTDGGIDPVWSKDGRELFYRHGDELMSVSVAATRGFSPGRPTRLFETRFDIGDNGPNYDVSPDGKWFVMTRSDRGPAPGELHVVLNWFSEVTARTQAEKP